MAIIYTSDSLRNLFQSSFNLAQWYSFLQYFFNASELKEKHERINRNLFLTLQSYMFMNRNNNIKEIGYGNY